MTSFFKRVFSRQAPKNVTKSIRCPEQMWDALTALSKEHGESPNAFIILVLDQYLQVQIEHGKIKVPKFEEEIVGETA